MNPNTNQARSRLINQVLDATTLPQIKVAQEALSDWMRVHPEDQGMRDGFEQLSLMEDIAEMEAAGLLVEEAPPDLGTCDPDEGRKWVINQVAKATTRPEITNARAALTQWLQTRPNDELRQSLDMFTLLLDLAQEREDARQNSAPAETEYAA